MKLAYIRKLTPQEKESYKPFKYIVGVKGDNTYDGVGTFGRAIRYWLWRSGVSPKIAFGWFRRKCGKIVK